MIERCEGCEQGRAVLTYGCNLRRLCLPCHLGAHHAGPALARDCRPVRLPPHPSYIAALFGRRPA